MEKCTYTQEYNNWLDAEQILFECKEMTDLASGLCIFHDSNSVQGNDSIQRTNLLNKFKEKIHHDIFQYNKLEFIGYYFPDIEFASLLDEISLTIIREKKVDFYFQYATFFGKANFSDVSFSGEADFSNATFSGEADFSNVSFTGGAYFFDTTFSQESKFSEATFLGEISSFSGTLFSKVSFTGANFSGGTSFSNATFSGEADFSKATFSVESHFVNTTFSEKASFTKVNFKGNILFTNANFKGKVSFSEATFLARAAFISATFSIESDFSGATFSGEADFFTATFSGELYFTEASFVRQADFSEITFSGKMYFFTATFSGEAYFNEATFCGKTIFSNATFSGETYFTEASFSGEIVFFNTTFARKASFYKTTFSGLGDFTNAKFSKTIFSYSIFSKQVTFNTTIFKDFIEFHNVLFEEPEKTVFEVNDLSNVSFLNTDITRVRFSDGVRWGGKKVEYDKFWGRKKVKEERFKIVDERILEEKNKDKENIKKDTTDNGEEKVEEKESHTPKNFNLGSIKAVYRGLRENYEYRMRYDEAGQFFIREMELKRMYKEIPSIEEENSIVIKQNNWFKRNLFSLTGLYYHLSRYGEDLLRPTIAGIVIVLITMLFFTTQSRPTLEPILNFTNVSPDIAKHTSSLILFKNFTNSEHWLKAFERSIADFIPLLPLGSDIKVGVIDYVIKILGGALTFGLIAIALRRRFERRYRH